MLPVFCDSCVVSKDTTTTEKFLDLQYCMLMLNAEQTVCCNYMCKHGFIDFNEDTSTPFSCIPPIDSLNHVEFREELLTSTPKQSSYPELLRQLALEVINNIPDQALIIYIVFRTRVEQGVVFLVTLLGMMLKSASGIMTTVSSLDRNSLLLVVLSIMLSTLIRKILDPDK
ncbi:RNase H domain-containing protein [Trichonephila clavipes]|nr:RNase H domain-containing protein [Trichonephila clavipes]